MHNRGQVLLSANAMGRVHDHAQAATSFLFEDLYFHGLTQNNVQCLKEGRPSLRSRSLAHP